MEILVAPPIHIFMQNTLLLVNFACELGARSIYNGFYLGLISACPHLRFLYSVQLLQPERRDQIGFEFFICLFVAAHILVEAFCT